LGGGIYVRGDTSLTITNCILWEDLPDEINVHSGTANVTYSDVGGAGLYPGEGNINGIPWFRSGGDYRLDPISPCIDAGNDSAPSLPATDLDDKARIQDVPPVDTDAGSVDMGAYEYDDCPDDPDKGGPGVCGCGVPDTDSDNDGEPDCNDVCPNDPDDDIDGDGVCGDVDNCPDVPNSDQADMDDDGVGDACADDVDGDGYPMGIDCDDMDPNTSPGASEVCSDGIDNDCDGYVDFLDWNCWGTEGSGGSDCFIDTMSTSLGM
jgi:hypothetical protein